MRRLATVGTNAQSVSDVPSRFRKVLNGDPHGQRTTAEVDWAPSMTLPPGTRLGPFEVTALLGAGGMGEVIYGLEQSGATPCIIMELLEGETLRARVARGPLPEEDAVAIAVAVAEALATVHAKGITHRDLKPENIFLTSDARTKVLDFGLARRQAPSSDPDLTVANAATEVGAIMGTVGYMSPEQVRCETAGATSDIFSLGCVIYEMLTARRAFDRPSTAETLAAILKDEPQGLDRLPSNVERVIGRCLQKHPRERFQSARDLAFDLRKAHATAADTAPLDSLAVLPFTNAGGPDAEYLSDGIAESLTNAFSQIARLRVVPRSLVARYKGQEIDPRVVGRELDARMLLSGKVVERGGRLSVQVELVDAAANKQLWGERLHRPLEDIFEVEEEITRQIAEKLRVRLSGDEKRQLARRYTENSDAYQLYLKARYHFLKRTPEGLAKGIQYCEEAIEKDPDYALAHAALSDCYGVLAAVGPSAPRPLALRAKAAAIRAVESDGTLAEAHNSLAYARAYCDWDWAGADAGFRHALELNPASWITHDWYALTLGCRGLMDEALAHNRRALELEPLSVVLHHHGAWLSWLAHRYDDAIELSRKTLELDAGFGWAYLWSGLALEQKDRSEDAVAALRKASELIGGFVEARAALAHALAISDRRDEAENLLAEIEHPSTPRYVDAYAVAVVYAALGDLDRTFTWLEKAFEEVATWLTICVKCDPRFDPLRADPRFQGLLRRMRLDH
jgi:eukaryotic-like serine/threonine-protein kinase